MISRMTTSPLKIPWHFRTIGLGTINYRYASKRLATEVNNLGIFETSVGYSEGFIKEYSPKFWSDHKNILRARTPGFGWYIWKPEFIRLSLEKIPKGHGLMYCDAGNLVSSGAQDLSQLIQYLNLGSHQNIVASNSQEFIEENYSSSELISLLNLSESQKKSKQFLAGFLLITHSEEGVSFVNSWRNLACLYDHEYLIPSTTQSLNPNFDTHRHDQAILSCLLKKYQKQGVYIGDKQNLGCVRAVRHRFGYSYKNPNCISKVIFDLIYFVSRVKLGLEHRIFFKSLTLRPKSHN